MSLVSTSGESKAADGIVVFDPSQRAKAVRAAQWHSRAVYGLRFILPTAVVCLAAGYVIALQFSTKISDDTQRGTFSISSVDLLSTQPTMRNPTYTGYNQKDGTEYTIRADRAVTDMNESKPIDLFGIKADIKQTDGTTIQMSSAEGQFDRQKDKLELFKDIEIVSSNEMSATLSSALIFPKRGIVKSTEPVSMQFPAGTLKGRKLYIEQKKNHIHLTDGVTARLVSNADGNTENSSSGQKKEVSSGLVALSAQSDQPVDIKSEELFIQSEKQLASFIGDVSVVQDATKLTAKTCLLYTSPSPRDA